MLAYEGVFTYWPAAWFRNWWP